MSGTGLRVIVVMVVEEVVSNLKRVFSLSWTDMAIVIVNLLIGLEVADKFVSVLCV